MSEAWIVYVEMHDAELLAQARASRILNQMKLSRQNRNFAEKAGDALIALGLELKSLQKHSGEATYIPTLYMIKE